MSFGLGARTVKNRERLITVTQDWRTVLHQDTTPSAAAVRQVATSVLTLVRGREPGACAELYYRLLALLATCGYRVYYLSCDMDREDVIKRCARYGLRPSSVYVLELGRDWSVPSFERDPSHIKNRIAFIQSAHQSFSQDEPLIFAGDVVTHLTTHYGVARTADFLRDIVSDARDSTTRFVFPIDGRHPGTEDLLPTADLVLELSGTGR